MTSLGTWRLVMPFSELTIATAGREAKTAAETSGLLQAISASLQTDVPARLAKLDTGRSMEVRLQGWEEFDEKVDRIVSIGAFEHFGHDRYDAFFNKSYEALPSDGTMLLHTITGVNLADGEKLGLKMTFELARFAKFIMTEIFPGGRLPSVSMVEERATAAGFTVSRVQMIGPHYVKTLQGWAAALEAHREEAIAAQSQEVYDRYDKYLNGCVRLFRDGYTNLGQFTLQK